MTKLAHDRPPLIHDNKGRVHVLPRDDPLHQLARKRIESGRDLKIIITARNSQTGVGKTTLAGFLALTWTKQFAGLDWYCDPDEPANGMATLDPQIYFEIIKDVGTEWPAGTTVLVDDAEELDSRRSMQDLNVKFSQRWMLMRLKQAITIITLPSPSSIDSRLEELSDVWINVTSRGKATIHDLRVEDYGSRGLLTKQSHELIFPNISDHPELNKLREMKENKMDSWDEESESISPDEVEKETKVEHAQRLREMGLPIESQDPDQPDIVTTVGMSQSWVSKNTVKPEKA